ETVRGGPDDTPLRPAARACASHAAGSPGSSHGASAPGAAGGSGAAGSPRAARSTCPGPATAAGAARRHHGVRAYARAGGLGAVEAIIALGGGLAGLVATVVVAVSVTRDVFRLAVDASDVVEVVLAVGDTVGVRVGFRALVRASRRSDHAREADEADQGQ